MTIKETRKAKGLTQMQAVHITGVPLKTLQNWEAFESGSSSSEIREPSEWKKNLVIEKLLNYDVPKFKIRNSSVENYAEICKRFSNDTVNWDGLDEYKFYTTCGNSWQESSDNAFGGVDVSWAFHMSDKEIELRSPEQLFEYLMQEINVAIDNECEVDILQSIYDKFNF